MKKALLLLLVLPAIVSCRLSDILLPIVLSLLVVGIGGTLLYAVVYDWIGNRNERKKQNVGK